MFKFFTVGLLLLSSFSVQAMDGLDMALDISMKNIVRSKLWYQGVEIEQKSTVSNYKYDKLPIKASEELVVAVDKFEQI